MYIIRKDILNQQITTLTKELDFVEFTIYRKWDYLDRIIDIKSISIKESEMEIELTDLNTDNPYFYSEEFCCAGMDYEDLKDSLDWDREVYCLLKLDGNLELNFYSNDIIDLINCLFMDELYARLEYADSISEDITQWLAGAIIVDSLLNALFENKLELNSFIKQIARVFSLVILNGKVTFLGTLRDFYMYYYLWSSDSFEGRIKPHAYVEFANEYLIPEFIPWNLNFSNEKEKRVLLRHLPVITV